MNNAFLFRCMFIKTKVEPLMTALTEIANGLSCYNMLALLKENVKLFEPVFCPSSLLVWEYEDFVDILSPEFSEEGTTKRYTEVNIYKLLIDFIESCFCDGMYVFIYASLLILSQCINNEPICLCRALKNSYSYVWILKMLKTFVFKSLYFQSIC